MVLSLLVALHLAKAAAFIAAGQGPLQGDSLVYWSLGERVAAGNLLLLDDPPEVARTPGYPWFVAFFQATCGRRALAAAIITQHLLLLGTVALAAWACWLLTEKRRAVAICLALSLVCFSCFGVAVNLLSDTLLSFLLALSVALAVAWWHAPSRWKAAALGLALGAAVLAKPVAQFAGLVACGWMLFGCRGHLPWRRRMVDCAVALAAALVLVAPWLVRNEVHFGQPFLARVAGRSLWWSCFKGNPDDRVDPPIPFADGPATRTVFHTVTTVSPHDTWRTSKELVRQGYSEIAADELMLQVAKEAISANPGRFVVSRCRRYVWFWVTPNGCSRPNTGAYVFGIQRARWTYDSLVPTGQTDNAVPGQATWSADWYFKRGRLNLFWHPSLLLNALAVMASAASIVVLFAAPRTRGLAVFLALWLGYFSAVTALTACPEYRYRMVLEPAMIVLAACAADSVVERVFSRRRHARSADLPLGGPTSSP